MGLRNLDAVACRYGKLPHSFVTESEDWDDYQRYCFDEAVAIAGLSQLDPKSANESSKKIKEPFVDETQNRVIIPKPEEGAIIGTFNNVPFIRGTVPVRKKKR